MNKIASVSWVSVLILVAIVVTGFFGLGALLALSPDTPAGLSGLLFGFIGMEVGLLPTTLFQALPGAALPTFESLPSSLGAGSAPAPELSLAQSGPSIAPLSLSTPLGKSPAMVARAWEQRRESCSETAASSGLFSPVPNRQSITSGARSVSGPSASTACRSASGW